VPYVTQQLEHAPGPVIAASDYLKAIPDGLGRWIRAPFVPLGTDGFGRSDTREALRRHFEVDAASIVVATLSTLCRQGQIPAATVQDAIREFGIQPDAIDPRDA
jgi:pyruvate dehydrogenase E1 component